MTLKARTSLRRKKGICPSDLYNGVLAFHLQKFCAGPKNKTQVGGSDRIYAAGGGCCGSALRKMLPRGSVRWGK